MNKKVGFWKWLYISIKEMPTNLNLMIKHPFIEAIIGIFGMLFTFPFAFLSPLLIPIPIVCFFMLLHGVYRLGEEE